MLSYSFIFAIWLRCLHDFQENDEEYKEEAQSHTFEPEIEERAELRTLRRLWPLFLAFLTLHPPEGTDGQFLVGDTLEGSNKKISDDARLRETFVQGIIELSPGLSASAWLRFLTRLILALHNDLGLFCQVQLPFIAAEAASLGADHRRIAAFGRPTTLEEGDQGAPLDVWSRTRTWVRVMSQHDVKQKIDVG